MVEFEVYRAITEGDLVGTHTHVKTANLAVDIFFTTMNDGKIVETRIRTQLSS